MLRYTSSRCLLMRTDLQRNSSCGTDASGIHAVAGDGEASDFSLGEGTAQTIDIGGVDDVCLNAGSVQFGGVDAPGGNTVGRKCSALDACAAVNVPV